MNLREEYVLEKERIVEQHGDLEKIRLALGLNRRRLCRLLLVDPSAWTRWCNDGAPPHIYQALRWLIELRGVRPDITAPGDLAGRMDLIQSSLQKKIHELEMQVEMLERSLALTRAITERAVTNSPRRAGNIESSKTRRRKIRAKRKRQKKSRKKISKNRRAKPNRSIKIIKKRKRPQKRRRR